MATNSNGLELVVEVDVNKANASMKSVNASLSSMEAPATKSATGAAQRIDGMTAAMVKGATAGSLFADAIKSALAWAKEFTVGSAMMAAEAFLCGSKAILGGMVNRQWRLVARPVGPVKESDFEWREEPAPEPDENQLLVRNIYLSLDPAMRGWMREGPSYLPPVRLGDVMRGTTLGVVEQSCHPNFTAGDLVRGVLGWQEYALSDGAGLSRESRHPAIPLTAYMAVFGHIGLTAYVGVLDIGKPQAGETLVVTAAAGAVGSLAGQIGKIHGCRVVGIAGSDEKCRWLTAELGFDAAINYRTENVLESLRRHCPNGIDLDFENVGGEILDAILALINRRARIVLCGLISQYNATAPVPGPYNFTNVLVRRARIEGFIVVDHWGRAPTAMADLGRWLAEGRLKYRVDVVEGLENTPLALTRLFDGSNQGKLVVKIGEEPAP